MGCVLRSSNKLITLYIYIYYIICIGWVQVTFSNGTSLNIFLLDVYFDKSFIKYIVSLYFQCLRNINMFRDQ